jgi:catechol 2,3-dioxygenase-like lactoylglutathione lyase family enzyme
MLMRMSRLPIGLALFVALASTPAAELSKPNAAGVAMGHLHYVVNDVEATRRFWLQLGGSPARVGSIEAVEFPDVLVLIERGAPSGTSEGAIVNHVAFRVPAFKDLESRGLTVTPVQQFPGVGSVVSPEGERVELFENAADNTWFTPDSGLRDPTADRHNQKVTVPIVPHHIHLYVPEGREADARAWYVRAFGALPGKRWRYEAADLPGINLNFSAAPRPVAPMKGRTLDHVGFEVAGLDAFCRKLDAAGIRLDVPYSRPAGGFARARLTDPWGTSIELTEGLGAQVTRGK